MSINVLQKMVVEHDDPEFIHEILLTLLPLTFDKKRGEHVTLHAKAEQPHMFRDGRWDDEQNDGLPVDLRKPTRLWVATLADYAGDLKPDDVKFSNHEDMAQYALEQMKLVTREDMVAAIGDGYGDCFMRGDGTVTIGYRINQRPNCGWNLIDVSVVHMYYGK